MLSSKNSARGYTAVLWILCGLGFYPCTFKLGPHAGVVVETVGSKTKWLLFSHSANIVVQFQRSNGKNLTF